MPKSESKKPTPQKAKARKPKPAAKPKPKAKHVAKPAKTKAILGPKHTKGV